LSVGNSQALNKPQREVPETVKNKVEVTDSKERIKEVCNSNP